MTKRAEDGLQNTKAVPPQQAPPTRVGGGHHAAGTCQGPNETADALKQELIETLVAKSRRAHSIAA